MKMAQFIKEFENFEIENIKKIVYGDQRSLKQSELYSSVSETKFIDTEKRSSKYKLFTSFELFEEMEKIVNVINGEDEVCSFSLVRNDLTLIQYTEGDFFKSHEDYLSFTSNEIEEYTLILCLNSGISRDSERWELPIGGETKIEINKFFSHLSRSSITPGSVLLFRKDLVHSGELLIRGFKDILTANLISFPKNKKDDALVISHLSNPKKRFILTKGEITSFENFFIPFLDSGSFEYVESREDISPEMVSVIVKIFKRRYISAREFALCDNAIKFYNIPLKNILICEKDTLPSPPPFTLEDDLILLEDEKELKYIIASTRSEGEKYLPFKMVLTEGDFIYNGDWAYPDRVATPIKKNMGMRWLSFGERQCLYYIRKVVLGPFENVESEKILEVEDIEMPMKKIIFNEEDGFESCYPVLVNLEIETDFSNEEIFESIYKEDSQSFEIAELPLLTREIQHSEKSKHYSLDSEGKIFVSKENLPDIKKRLSEFDIEKEVISKIQSGVYSFPQRKESINSDFCNEQVYGMCNVIFVNGLLKME